MKAFLEKLNNALRKGVSIISGTMLILLTGIVFLQVIVRYVFNSSLGGVEELPAYLMILCAWVTGAINARSKGHISMDLMDFFIKNQTILTVIRAVVQVLTAIVLLLFGYLGIRYFAYTFEMGNRSPGMEFPFWILVAFMLACTALMIIYTITNAIDEAKEVRKHAGRN